MTQLSRSRRLFCPQSIMPVVCRDSPRDARRLVSGVGRAADVFQLSGDEANALFDKAKAAVVQVRSGDKGLSQRRHRLFHR